MRGFCTCTTGRDVPRNAASTAAAMPPQPMARPGSGAFTASATAVSGLGQSFAGIHFHGAAGCEDPDVGGQPGGFGEAEGLGAQAGKSLADDPRGGDVRHGGAFRRGAAGGQWLAGQNPNRHGPARFGTLPRQVARTGGA